MTQNVGNLTVRGRIGQQDTTKGKATVEYDIDWTGPEDYIFDFTLVQQGLVFSVPSSMFLDNSVNPSPVEVYVGQTGQYFPVPPYSSGWFTLTAQENSTITLSSQGGVLNNDKCFVSFANYDVPPNVWNGFAPLVDGARVKIIGVNGIADQGATNPVIVGGNNGGAPVPIQVDAQGRISVIGSAAGGVSYGPDDQGVAPTRAPNVIAGVDGGGIVRRILTTVAGILRVSVDTSVLPTGAATEVTSAAILTRANSLGSEVTLASILTRANLLATQATAALIQTAADAIKINTDRATTGVASTVPQTGASVTLLVAAAGRKKFSIFADGVGMKVKFAASAATATDFSVYIPSGGFYEAGDYTGEIRAISDSAIGNACITSYT